MPDRTIRLIISGDASGGLRAIRQTEEATERGSKSFDKHGRAAAGASHHVDILSKSTSGLRNVLGSTAGIIGLAGLGFGIKDVVQAGMTWQTQQKSLQQALKNTGQYSAATMKQLDAAAEAGATHGGFAAPQELSAIQQFTTETGNATRAAGLNKEAMDLARGAHLDYGQTVKYIGTAVAGSAGRLSKYLGTIIPVTKYTLGWTAAMEAANPVGYAHAEMQNKIATATMISGLIQKKFGDQTTAYGKTTAGALSNAKNALDILFQRLGSLVLPLVARIARSAASGVTWVTNHLPQIGAVASRVWNVIKTVVSTAFSVIKTAVERAIAVVRSVVTWFRHNKDAAIALGIGIGTVVAALTAYKIATTAAAVATGIFNAVMDANPIIAVSIAVAALIAGFVYLYLKVKVFRDIVQGVFKVVKFYVTSVVTEVVDFIKRGVSAIVTIFNGLKEFFSGVWNLIKGIFTLNVSEMWKGVEQIFGGAIKTVIGILQLIIAPFAAVWNGLKRIVTPVINWIIGAVKWLVDKAMILLGPVLDAIHAVAGIFSSKMPTLTLSGAQLSQLRRDGPGVERQLLSKDRSKLSAASIAALQRQIASGLSGTPHMQTNATQGASTSTSSHTTHVHVMLGQRQIAEAVVHEALRRGALS